MWTLTCKEVAEVPAVHDQGSIWSVGGFAFSTRAGSVFEVQVPDTTIRALEVKVIYSSNLEIKYHKVRFSFTSYAKKEMPKYCVIE